MRKLLSSMVVVGLLSTSVFASDTKTEAVKHNAVVKAEKKAENTALIKEAVRALKYTEDAYIYLNAKDKTKATASLKKAIGELTIVLNAPNSPYLLPVDINVNASEYVGTLDNISKQITTAKIALAKHNLILARNILNSLKSEVDIKTVNIPLATYPDAIKLAVKYINEDKVKEAKDVIAMTLHTLVTTDTIIPIPLVKSNDLVSMASKISHKDHKQTLRYLDEAKRQLRLAELLGYTSSSDTTYKVLKDKINKIETKINNHKNTDSLFEDLKNKIKEFKEKAVSIISK